MSIGQVDATRSESSRESYVSSAPSTGHRPLHRLLTVRRMQGLSRRTIARRLNVEVDVVRQQEHDTSDLPLSILYAWQKAMDVPAAELLVDGDDSVPSPVLRRAQLVRLMKSVLAIRQQAKQESIRRMAQTMWEQLVEMMPELAEIGPWHAVGKRRRLSELGMAAQRHLTERVFIDRGD